MGRAIKGGAMSKYVIADIHGEYDMFLELLQKTGLRDSDELYILGDVVDRGPHPIRTLLKLMDMPNVVPIVGNHELIWHLSALSS